MGVPVAVVVGTAGVELHEPDAALDQPAGQQAAAAEVRRPLLVRGRRARAWLRRFLAQIDRLGSVLLHREGQLVAGDPGGQVAVVAARGDGARRCTRASVVEQVALHARSLIPAGAFRSRIGVAGRAEDRALVGGRHVAARPVLGAADRAAGRVEHHDEAGQVLVHAPQAVVDPRAQARAALRGSCPCSSAASPSRGSASRRSSSGGTRCRRRRWPGAGTGR